MTNKAEPEPPTRYWNYRTAPTSPVLAGTGITERQLRRATSLGRLSYTRPGLVVLFSDEHLRDWLERSTVKATR